MKTLLLSTDFSADATHAADFGYELAKQIKADIVICNAVIVPAEMPQAGLAIWPTDEYEMLMNESASELNVLKDYLEKRNESLGFKPTIKLFHDSGTVTDVVSEIVSKQNIDLIIIGPHSNSGISSFVLGNHTRKLIDTATKPLLLVPRTATLRSIKKIAFAADFKQPEKDLEYVTGLIPLAKALHAEVLITHVYTEKSGSPDFQLLVKQFIEKLTISTDYPEIYYRLVKNKEAEHGLDWLCEHGQIDMLAMVHREHTFFESILKGSCTQKMAGHISIPLLVFPSKP